MESRNVRNEAFVECTRGTRTKGVGPQVLLTLVEGRETVQKLDGMGSIWKPPIHPSSRKPLTLILGSRRGKVHLYRDVYFTFYAPTNRGGAKYRSTVQYFVCGGVINLSY